MKKFEDWNNDSIRGQYIKDIKRICETYSDIIDIVVLFGSVAICKDTNKSDIDLYVYSEKLTTSKLFKHKHYNNFIINCFNITEKTKTDIDFIVSCSKDRDRRNFINSLLYKNIEETGVILFDKRTESI